MSFPNLFSFQSLNLRQIPLFLPPLICTVPPLGVSLQEKTRAFDPNIFASTTPTGSRFWHHHLQRSHSNSPVETTRLRQVASQEKIRKPHPTSLKLDFKYHWYKGNTQVENSYIIKQTNKISPPEIQRIKKCNQPTRSRFKYVHPLQIVQHPNL